MRDQLRTRYGALSQRMVLATSGCGTLSHRLVSPQNTIRPNPSGRMPSAAAPTWLARVLNIVIVEIEKCARRQFAEHACARGDAGVYTGAGLIRKRADTGSDRVRNELRQQLLALGFAFERQAKMAG